MYSVTKPLLCNYSANSTDFAVAEKKIVNHFSFWGMQNIFHPQLCQLAIFLINYCSNMHPCPSYKKFICLFTALWQCISMTNKIKFETQFFKDCHYCMFTNQVICFGVVLIDFLNFKCDL